MHAGIDDDCDGAVDEGCACVPGLAQACFKGNPSYRDDPGCFAGTQHCTPGGVWGPCTGGVHATDACYLADTGCHAIASLPLVPVNLKDTKCEWCGNLIPTERHLCSDKVKEISYVCNSCGRTAVEGKYLCKPKKIE